tara:strand:+ start:1514 stop:1693 length:180 start_codon:yes stop_codon:yes gene_type:complete
VKKLLGCLNNKYVVAGILFGLADGILGISNNLGEFVLYLVTYIFVIFCLKLFYKKFSKK